MSDLHRVRLPDMSDRLAWLRAQIEARKATAEAATQGEWINDGSIYVGHEMNELVDYVYEAADAVHIVGNQPRDTIARCDAELALLDQYEQARTWYEQHHGAPAGEVQGLWTAVRLVAQGYQHHDGYREMWAP